MHICSRYTLVCTFTESWCGCLTQTARPDKIADGLQYLKGVALAKVTFGYYVLTLFVYHSSKLKFLIMHHT